MSISAGAWQAVVLDFSEDDDLTSEVNLGGDCDFVQIIIPTLDSCTVSLQVARDSGGTFYTLGSSQTTGSGTHNYATVFNLGGYQFIKIVTSAAQTADRTFYVRGRKY